MSSAKRRFVIVLPQILTVPSWSSSASAIILSNKMLKRVRVRADITGELQLWFGTILQCCCHGRLHWWPSCSGILWF